MRCPKHCGIGYWLPSFQVNHLRMAAIAFLNGLEAPGDETVANLLTAAYPAANAVCRPAD
jgi:hypothetical protein